MRMTAYFGNCERKLFVSLDVPKVDDNYNVIVRVTNSRDVHPLQLQPRITRKTRYGFEVELDQYTDSPYYALQCEVWEDALLAWDPGTPPPFEKRCSCDGHTLLHKGCQCGAVTKRKWGLGA